MNYQKIHDSIISNAVNRGALSVYTEKHHIVPKSMGGSNRKSNIAVLTAREHFMVHWLLKKIHKSKSMTYAFFAMTKMGNKSQERYTSHSFKYARESMASHLSNNMSGKNHPFYGLKGKDSPSYGMKRGEEARKNMSEACMGKRVGLNNCRSRQIKNMTTGEVFESARQAQLKTSGNVYYAAYNGGTASGDEYRFLDKEGGIVEPKVKLKGYRVGSSNPSAKAVVNITTGAKHSTLNSAANEIGKTASAISWGIKNNKAVGGFLFKRI